MAEEQTLTITAKFIDQASNNVKQVESSLVNLGKTVLSIYTLKQGFDFLATSINKAAAEEKNLKTLQTVIENQGESWGRVKEKVTDYISAMEYNTMFTDEQLIPSMKQLINAGMNAEQAMRALSSATDLATAKGLDLETSANLIGKAYMGNTEQLKRYGIVADDFNGLMGQINEKFGGSARKDMDTYAGSVKKLETTWDQFQKTLGTNVIPEVNKLVLALDTLLGGKPSSNALPEQTKALDDLNEKIEAYRVVIKRGTDARTAWIDQDVSWVGSVKVENKELDNQQLALQTLMKLYKEKDTFLKTAKPPKANDFTALPSKKEQDEETEAYRKMLQRQYEATYEVRNQIDEINMGSFDFEMQLIEQKAEAYQQLGVLDVDINKWVASEKIEAITKEYKLRQITEQMIETFAIGSAEQQKYLIADILEAFLLAESKKEGALALKSALNLDLAGAATHTLASIALGYGASVVHQETERDKALEQAKQDAKTDELQKKMENAATSSSGKTTIPPVYNSGVSNVTSIASQSSSAPTYYINSNYYLNAGIMLGDESVIDALFAKLMTKYELMKQLTVS